MVVRLRSGLGYALGTLGDWRGLSGILPRLERGGGLFPFPSSRPLREALAEWCAVGLRTLGGRVGVSLPGKVAPMRKRADPFYESPEWKAAVRTWRARWCKVCGSTKRLVLDHIVERKDGGSDLDPANLQTLCHACHQRKTADARARRATGQR